MLGLSLRGVEGLTRFGTKSPYWGERAPLPASAHARAQPPPRHVTPTAGASLAARPLPLPVAAAAGGTRGRHAGAVSAPPEQGQPMTQRALSVLVLASAALIVYFVIRTVRLRRRSRKTRRYGVLDTNIENMELTPLEQDDEEDDTTLFDANHPRRYVCRS
uniref:Transmembrane protein 157 n=3 Tax=Tinamidae TaxID=8803 RepID=A0A8C6ZZM0_NOTPE